MRALLDLPPGAVPLLTAQPRQVASSEDEDDDDDEENGQGQDRGSLGGLLGRSAFGG